MLQRRRSCILEAIEQCRKLEPSVNLSQLIAFLYICENEGLSTAELAVVMRTSRATASRVARSLTAADYHLTLPPSVGWVAPSKDAAAAQYKGLHLTKAGLELRRRLDEIIAEGRMLAG
jgi:DNA-binding MarR family transcriptional regulator